MAGKLQVFPSSLPSLPPSLSLDIYSPSRSLHGRDSETIRGWLLSVPRQIIACCPNTQVAASTSSEHFCSLKSNLQQGLLSKHSVLEELENDTVKKYSSHTEENYLTPCRPTGKDPRTMQASKTWQHVRFEGNVYSSLYVCSCVHVYIFYASEHTCAGQKSTSVSVLRNSHQASWPLNFLKNLLSSPAPIPAHSTGVQTRVIMASYSWVL